MDYLEEAKNKIDQSQGVRDLAHKAQLTELAMVYAAIAQAEAAAQRAFVYLSKGRLTAARMTSKVHDSLCARCRTCITACPFEARSYDVVNHRVTVDAATCQGCGICAVACPNGAAELKGPNDRQNLAIIEASLMGSWSAGP